MAQLQKVSTNFYQNNASQQWKEPFNQATFFNYDPNNPIRINKFILPVAQTVSGNVYPSYMTINLNRLEINDTNFTIDTNGSTTANYHIIYTQYLGVE